MLSGYLATTSLIIWLLVLQMIVAVFLNLSNYSGEDNVFIINREYNQRNESKT